MIYAIGDIHGEFLKLASLLNKLELLGLTPQDRLIFLGDYIDRGPDTRGVIDLLIKLREQRPNTVFLRGNHDQVMLNVRDYALSGEKTRRAMEEMGWWLENGGRATIASYNSLPTNEAVQQPSNAAMHQSSNAAMDQSSNVAMHQSSNAAPWHSRIPDSHWDFLNRTIFEYREGTYTFVHAGLVPPGVKWTEPDDPRLWIREEFISSKADFGTIVVFGHTPQDLFFPIVMDNKLGIDTGAAYGGPLTAVALESSNPYQPTEFTFFQS